MGVWIETLLLLSCDFHQGVTPRVGVWIETGYLAIFRYILHVTPRVGVWIETINLPVASMKPVSHSPRGSVD